jgi:glycosyltransferase involved in cell wall biosynthesis
MVSIIVPCFKQAEYLDECLTSVLDQTYTNWECIVVDDGSPDNTEEIMSFWTKKDERFRYLKKQNGGLAAARNSGIMASNGTFILPLDADDKISENYIEYCVKVLESSESNKLAYGRSFKFGVVNEEWKLETYSFEKLKFNNMIYCTALFRKSDWEKIGGYDESGLRGWEDWDFWLSLLKNGGEVIYIHDIIFYYRIKEESMIKSLVKDEEMMLEKRAYLFDKHREIYTKLSNYELFLQTTFWKKNADFENRLNQMKVTELISLVFNKIKNRLFK